MVDRETWIRRTCAAAFPRDTPPNIVHQSWRDANIPEAVTRFVSGWRNLPNFTHRLWADGANRQLFAAHTPELLPLYDGYTNAVERAVDVLRAFHAEDLRVLRWLCASEWVEASYCAAVEARTQYEF